MTVLMVFDIIADWEGRPMGPKEPICIRTLEFNRTCWMASDILASVLIFDGGTITLRRDGQRIFVERP